MNHTGIFAEKGVGRSREVNVCLVFGKFLPTISSLLGNQTDQNGETKNDLQVAKC